MKYLQQAELWKILVTSTPALRWWAILQNISGLAALFVLWFYIMKPLVESPLGSFWGFMAFILLYFGADELLKHLILSPKLRAAAQRQA